MSEAQGGPVMSADEMHAYLVDQLNHALRRPGMFGGEIAILMLLDHLLFMEGQLECRWEAVREPLRERGASTAIGVKGVFRELIRGRDEHDVASVYAEFAHQRRWLHADRLLDARTHESLMGRASEWAAQDRQWPDVVAEFGEPSILFGGTNPRYGKTLAYVSEDPGHPLVFFHLWNGDLDEASPTWKPSYEQPVLWAVRLGDRPFQESFTFTPTWPRLRPQ
ncbi:hypothetical protein [Streptomyces justiciae]|uniref:Uncharacterized protein n=1 Tax=Streptomyces justiciae TaxID=2780140 RepID=A0ABU3LWZ7_9ACTN|nr:hypothetical protein [Streptomyces justiciae]MDT7843063.1 hypothetical protein [Streptomyces justiciae]